MTVLVVVLLGAAVIVVAAGGEDDADEPAAAADSQNEDEPEVFDAGTDDETLENSELFEDPEGLYRITLDEDWDPFDQGIPTGVEAFLVATPEDGFGPNVTILTAEDAPGMDEEEYLEAGLERLRSMGPATGVEMLDSGTFEGPTGNDLAFAEFTQRDPTFGELHQLQVFDIADGMSALATLTVLADRFDEIRPEVEPFMRTLELQ